MCLVSKRGAPHQGRVGGYAKSGDAQMSAGLPYGATQYTGGPLRYGFIGLGNLGGHLAASLLREGFDLTVYDLNHEAARSLIGRGARWAQSPKGLATAVDVVITCLP